MDLKGFLLEVFPKHHIPTTNVFPNIGRYSLNYYAYFILFGLFALCCIFVLIRKRRLSMADIGRYFIILAFIIWLSMEALFSINYFIDIRSTYDRLYGRTLDEKRLLLSPEGVYLFSLFFSHNLPVNPKIFLLWQDVDTWEYLMLEYYLHPFTIVEYTKADYLVGYKISGKGRKNTKFSEYGWITEQ